MGSIPTVDDPLRRGSEHRDEDYERTVQKLLEHQFNDWPNEAGVSIIPAVLVNGD